MGCTEASGSRPVLPPFQAVQARTLARAGQHHSHAGTRKGRPALQIPPAPMRAGDFPDNGQPQPRAACKTAWRPIERFENTLSLFRGHARPIIFDGKARRVGPYLYAYHAGAITITQRV